MLRKFIKRSRATLQSKLPIAAGCEPIILCFHTVNNSSSRRGYVSEYRSQPMEEFVAQLDWLHSFCDFVSLDDIVQREIRSSSGRQRVALTFDDGYRDNLHTVLPVLEKYEAPVTLFVATEYLSNSMLPWWDFMDWSIEHGYLCDLISGRTGKETLSAGAIAEQRRHFKAVCRDGDQRARDVLVKSMADNCGCTEVNDFMDKKELADFARNPLVTIGAHTHKHINTALLELDELADELKRNIDILAEVTDTELECFAYPYGDSAQINPKSHRVLQDAGMKAAFTTIPTCMHGRHGMFDIPRMIVSPRTGLTEFKARVKKVLLNNKYSFLSAH